MRGWQSLRGTREATHRSSAAPSRYSNLPSVRLITAASDRTSGTAAMKPSLVDQRAARRKREDVRSAEQREEAGLRHVEQDEAGQDGDDRDERGAHQRRHDRLVELAMAGEVEHAANRIEPRRGCGRVLGERRRRADLLRDLIADGLRVVAR